MLGRSLGNYGVVSKIGEGGMGVVYLAKHVTLGRKAAVKVLRPALSENQDIVSRFFNEARAVTAIRNPGIVEVYDFGFLEDRTAYIIMEYLEGESLAARLRRGRPPIAVTLTIVRAIARALHAAHEQGVIHRDLKPDNVFLVPDSELSSGERVKLLDFGIAKLVHGVGNASHTTTGTVMGTPTYMSPEQCRGAGSVDHRADLYSLGCVAYEMLCGQPPFVAEGPGDVIARHLYFEPQSLRSRRSEIPAELEEIVLRLLKKEPRARYGTATELVRAIDELSGAPSPDAAPSKPLATEFVATIPMVKDTTLNGAASSSLSLGKDERGRRLSIVTAAVTVAIAAFVIVWVFARGGHGVDAEPNVAAALPVEPKPSVEGVSPPAAPQPAAPAPAAPASASPSGGAATPTPAAHPIDRAQGSGAADPAAGSTGGAASQSSSAPPAAPPSHDAKPREPGGVPPAPDEVPSGPARPHDATAGKEETPAVPPQSDGRERDGSGANDAPRPAKPRRKPDKGTTPSETPSPPAEANPPDTGCTRAAFDSVLDAKAPSPKAVKDAKSRLVGCRSSMDPGVYEDLYRRLIERL